MTVVEELDFEWSVAGACHTCLMVECECTQDIKEEPSIDTTINFAESNHEDASFFENLENDRYDAMTYSVTQKTIRPGVVMKWKQAGALRTVVPAIERTKQDFTDDEVFMREVRLWAAPLPEDTDEIVGWAMLKYAELLKSHPTSSFKSIKQRNAYYMTAIKNNQYDRGRKRKLDEQTMREMPEAEHRDIYPFQVMDWFSELNEHARKAVLEAMQWIDENPDKRLPERIQRKLRKITSRPEFN